MKRLSFLCSAILASLFISSCSQEITFPEDAQAVVSVSQKLEKLTLDRVSEIALAAQDKFTQNDGTKSKVKEIAEIIPFSSTKWAKESKTKSEGLESVLDEVFIVNYTNNDGFSIVSTNKELPEVFGYFENGNLQAYSEDIPGGLEIFLNQLPVFINGQYANSKDLITRSAPDTILGGDGYARLNFREEWGPIIFETVGPLLYTKWHQGDPYNSKCPLDNGIRSLVGCAAVAVGQITAYHKYPTVASFNNEYETLNWNVISNTADVSTLSSTDQNAVALLLRKIGHLENMHYGYNSSWSTITNANYALHNLGYQTSDVLPYNTSSICMATRIPAYVRGDSENSNIGHAWVVDGYSCHTQSRYIIADLYDAWYNYIGEEIQRVLETVRTNYYVHCNWGWGGYCDGFTYSGSSIIAYNQAAVIDEFCTGLSMIIDIAPTSY